MKTLLLVAVGISILGSCVPLHAQSLYFPPLGGSAWDTTAPASLGWHLENIDSLMSFLSANKTKAFMVLKDGRIVLERYFGTFTRDSNWYWASAGKTLTAFMIGIAQHDGLLALSDSTSRYLGTGWTSCPPDKEGLITIWNQLTMTTGLDDRVPDQSSTLPASLIYKADAGTRWAYHTGPYTLLDDVLENASKITYQAYFAGKIRSHLGMNGAWVQLGYDHVYISTARSMARFGLLVLNRGIWDADTVLADTAYFRAMTTPSQNLNPSYGYLWWLNGQTSYMVPDLQISFPGSWAPDAPADMIGALGKNGQFINIVPSQRLILIRMGEAPDSSYLVPMQFDNDIWKNLNRVMSTATSVADAAPPAQFALMQNWPNPCNPSTCISYSIASGKALGEGGKGGRWEWVRLSVYDLLGREVATLVNGYQTPGQHSVVFNASTLASGVYVYRLTSGGQAISRKLVLLR